MEWNCDEQSFVIKSIHCKQSALPSMSDISRYSQPPLVCFIIFSIWPLAVIGVLEVHKQVRPPFMFPIMCIS